MRFDLKIGYKRVLRSREDQYRNKKYRPMYSRGPMRRFFKKLQICPRTLKLGMWGFSDVRNTNMAIKNSPSILLRVCRSIFQELSISSPYLYWKIDAETLNNIWNGFLMLYSCSWCLKTLKIPIFKVRGQICIFETSMWRSSIVHDTIFNPIFVFLTSENPLIPNFEGKFENLVRIDCWPSNWSRSNFHIRIKVVCCVGKSSLPKFQLSEWYICEMGPKTKKGKPINEKVLGVGRVLKPICDFFGPSRYKKTVWKSVQGK